MGSTSHARLSLSPLQLPPLSVGSSFTAPGQVSVLDFLGLTTGVPETPDLHPGSAWGLGICIKCLPSPPQVTHSPGDWKLLLALFRQVGNEGTLPTCSLHGHVNRGCLLCVETAGLHHPLILEVSSNASYQKPLPESCPEPTIPSNLVLALEIC